MRGLDYIDEFGQGIDLMYEKMADWQLPEPLFDSVANQFRVTFLGEQFKPLNKRQITIWHYLYIHIDGTTALELQKLFPDVSKRTLIRDLNQMIDLRFIISAGSTNNLAYQIVL
jgi:predicted HTH transcriptional regulator